MRRAPWRKLPPQVRRRVLQRDGYRCQHCGRAGRLEVDHIACALRTAEAELALDNLQALCRECHGAKTRRENTQEMRQEWRAYLANLTRGC